MVGELGPLLLQFAFDDVPVTFDFEGGDDDSVLVVLFRRRR